MVTFTNIPVKINLGKNILDFLCSDTFYSSQAYYYRKVDKFQLNVFTDHIHYEERSYSIAHTIKETMESNKLIQLDFEGLN